MSGSLRWWLPVWLCLASVVMSSQFHVSVPRPSPESGLRLSPHWSVLGPFPAGMRELPFGGFPPAAAGSYADLFAENAASYLSTYGTKNGTTSRKDVQAEVQMESSNRVRQLLTVDYPDIDWAFIRQTAGWTALQWQMMAVADLEVLQDNTALAATFDKTAEFAIVPAALFTPELQEPIEWYTGDWYSYIASFSKEDPEDSLPMSHHLIHLDQGSYKLLVRSMYEIRIFADPQGGDPKIKIGIDLASRLCGATSERLIEVHTDSFHSNVPHVVGGWFAGWGLSFGLRSIASSETFVLQGVDVSSAQATLFTAKIAQTLTVNPGQTLVVPVMLIQHGEIPSDLKDLELHVSLSRISNTGKQRTFVQSVRIDLNHIPAFWGPSSKDDEHNSFTYSYLAPDHTVQIAAATPPKRAVIAKSPAHSAPVILAHHGAGVDIRDLEFSHSILRQEESWVIAPTGRSPWGYDWQLASFWAAEAAITSLHKHLYGMPPPCKTSASCSISDAERAQWNFDPQKVFVMGHSNGGQGAWYRLGRFPDQAIGEVVAAAYTKVADYVSFEWKVGRHYQDAMVDGLLHSSLTMFENDLYASNLVGIDLLVKYGSVDDNVPPWNSRDMAMVVESWNQRSNASGHVKVSEVANKPHWWDTVFSESDVQLAIEGKCTTKENAGFAMPQMPNRFTVSTANPGESGSKGGWKITEIETPGRIAKLEVFYSNSVFELQTSNAVRASFQLSSLRRYMSAGASTTLSLRINGRAVAVASDTGSELHFVKQDDGNWQQIDAHLAASMRPPRPLGPMLRIVSSTGPVSIIVPSHCAAAECKALAAIARRFAADLLLYGGINAQIVADTDFASLPSTALPQGNIVTLGGPHINSYTAQLLENWPSKPPFIFQRHDAQFRIRDRPFYANGTGLLALAPHPSNSEGLVLVLHGIGSDGIQRAARLLPTRTATMIPEWVVVDKTSEWMGQGGVKAAGWYDRHWGWSESMSYVE